MAASTRRGTASSASSIRIRPQTPVVICHGGPGAAHDYCEPIAELSRYGPRMRPLRPGRLRQEPAPARRTRRVLDAAALQGRARRADAALGIAGRHAVVGQSWGGMLAMEYALDHPPGLRGIVVADSPASMTLWVSEANRLRADLPADVQETLTRHEQAGTTDDPEYESGGAGLLRPAPVPCAVAGLRAAQLRPDGGRPDRLPHDERPERVPRRRLAQDLGHHRPAARDHDSDAARLGPPRRGDAADRRADPRAHPRLASGRCSRSRATCRTSRSPRHSSSASRSFLRSID